MQFYGIQISVSINKVSLEHSHTHPFMARLWWLPSYSDIAGWCGSDCTAHRV